MDKTKENTADLHSPQTDVDDESVTSNLNAADPHPVPANAEHEQSLPATQTAEIIAPVLNTPTNDDQTNSPGVKTLGKPFIGLKLSDETARALGRITAPVGATLHLEKLVGGSAIAALQRAATFPVIPELERLQGITRSIASATRLFDDHSAVAKHIALLRSMDHSIARFATVALPQTNYERLFGNATFKHLIPLTQNLDRLKIGSIAENSILGAATKLLSRDLETNARMRESLERITSPWVSSVSPFNSVSGMVELQHLGALLKGGASFDEHVSRLARKGLGDWRDVEISRAVNPLETHSLYAKQGFNSDLTDFPSPAFYQGMAVANLGSDSLDLELFGPLTPAMDEAEEEEEARNCRAYQRVFQLENKLRQFIDECMTAKYGQNWPRKKLPQQVYEDLVSLKQKKKNGGYEVSLVQCTDFTHYALIITKKDLWAEVFQEKFKAKRIEDVRESFARMKPIRDVTMHSNSVSHEDWLCFRFEADRILAVISWQP